MRNSILRTGVAGIWTTLAEKSCWILCKPQGFSKMTVRSNESGKVLLDTLQAAGLFKDDSQIKRILLEMHEPIEGGMCFIKLEDMDGIEWKNEDRTADDAGKSSRNS